MDSRERWQALQARLTAARAAVDAGDRKKALAAIDEALDIDPDFLAAHSLRDRILAPAEPAAPVARFAADRPKAPSVQDSRPAVSTEGYAKFEQRARRRRVDRRIDAARSALEHGQLKQAAAALDEVIELDPNLPELSALTARFDALRRTSEAAHRGPRLVAAAVFVVTIFGASWLQDSRSFISRSMIAAAPIVASPVPIVTVTEEFRVVGTAGERSPAAEPSAPIAPGASIEPAPSAPSVEESPVASPLTTPAPTPRIGQMDDPLIVQYVVQRYRAAYDEPSEQPGVRQVSDARPSDDLEPRTLAFGACDVSVRGEAATATCQSSTRAWYFTLQKTGGDWKIESARVER